MRALGVRYLVAKRQKVRTLHYWQPSAKLAQAGFLTRRLPDDPAEAVRAAQKLNAELDAWYQGAPLAPAKPPIGADTLLGQHELFLSDPAFSRMSPRTQRDYRYSIKAALIWGGAHPVRAVTRKAVKAWYRGRLRDGSAATARNAMAALRRLLSFAHDEGMIPENPALKMRVKTPESRSRVWSFDETERFCATAVAVGRPSMALAVMLGWCLGQRPADLRTLTWAAYDGHAVALRQAKTGTPIWVPCLPALRGLLDATRRTAPQIVVSEATGRPYLESDFQHRFADIRRAANLPSDLQFRDLRRTLATALGAAGCTDDQIRSVTGHKTRGVVAVYVRPDHTFAEGAIAKLEAGPVGRMRKSFQQ
jgi:integrase